MLNWSRADTAAAAHVSVNTLSRVENEATQPHMGTVMLLRGAFESAGIEFLFDPPGIRLRADTD